MTLPFLLGPWDRIAEVALTAVLIYMALLVMLRLSGKRTLAKFNAFDFVVTVAIGSMIANTILNDETPLVAGVIGIAVLILAQAVVSVGATRWRQMQRVVKSQPALLFYDGDFQQKAILRERVATEELRQAARNSGFGSMDAVLAIILENDGNLSVIGRDDQKLPLDALADVRTASADLETGQRLPPAARWDT